MRVMVVAIAVALVSIPGWGQAQSTPTIAAVPVVPAAPIVPSAPVPATGHGDDALVMTGGKEVSRPLTPVEMPTDLPQRAMPEQADAEAEQRVQDLQDQRYIRRGPLGPGWDDCEFLLWWPRSQALPPLVTASRSGQPPVLGSPGASVLIGGHSQNNQDIAGGRFVLGAAINSEETLGLEGAYFFLGSRTLKETIRSQNNPAAVSLGLPFVNSDTGHRDVFLIAAPGVSTGSVYFSSTTRLQGAEGNLIANFVDETAVRVNGIIGYRYLMVNQGIALADQRTELGAGGAYGPIYDGFDGHNQFNGGQLGLHADFTHGLMFCEITGKVAIGLTSEVVKIEGASTIYTPILGGVNAQTLPGGVYALPSNMGYYTHNSFAVAPEGTFKIGLKFGEVSRFFVGYNFLYLSELVRPADQIDRTLNPIQIPTLNPGATFTGADRPRVPFARTDFWTQGLIIGIETRY
jgi:hypothetical protein